MEYFTIDDAKKIVRAWESLPGNRSYSAKDIQSWLLDYMTPAIKELRDKITAYEEAERNR